jgi:transcriptional regulator with XRE-family HTH domain
VNQFGEHIKQIRERKGLLQKQIADHLEIDAPMLSKIERGERIAKKEHVKYACEILNISEEVLLPLWLADRVLNIIKDEKFALKTIKIVEKQIKTIEKNRTRE